MSKVDWSKAPEGAEFYAYGEFRKSRKDSRPVYFYGEDWVNGSFSTHDCKNARDYELRPTEWPDEARIDVIARNGPTGEHYEQVGTAASFLSEGMRILTERGEQYGSDKRECSFPQVAQAFNAITGKDMTGSDVCLILALVKQVRQYAQPERFHEDSAVDGVNYLALQAEQLKRERSNSA